jgi:hypothetical protein
MDNLLISLADIKVYLRIDGEEEDTLLAILLSVAIEHCENYLCSALPSDLPAPIKQALLILVGHFYEQRVGEDIPKVVYALLSPYRQHQW